MRTAASVLLTLYLGVIVYLYLLVIFIGILNLLVTFIGNT